MSTYPVPQCQHTKKDGSPCGSPALRNRQFCYYHDRQRPVLQDVNGSAKFPPAPFFLPLLEDANSIQRALGKVCDHLLHRRLDPKKAGVLLYALQQASTNLGRRNKSQKKSAP
ncbi:MAG: DUF5763 domain-containing protein [Terriglobales bacterium]